MTEKCKTALPSAGALTVTKGFLQSSKHFFQQLQKLCPLFRTLSALISPGCPACLPTELAPQRQPGALLPQQKALCVFPTKLMFVVLGISDRTKLPCVRAQTQSVSVSAVGGVHTGSHFSSYSSPPI